MTGNPDPMMGFPGGTHFTPYVTLRNTTSMPLALRPTLYLANPGQVKTFSMHGEVLAPYETRQVDIAKRMEKLKLVSFNGNINLTYSYVGQQGDLLMAAGGVDQTGTYVFQVLTQGIETGLAKDVAGWMVANGYDTMFTLWNHSKEPEDLIATFYFPDGSGQYRLPVHLEAYASMNIDMAQLVALNEPDADGHTFPQGITGGSVEFASPQGFKGAIALSVNAAEFNVANATCSSCCTCCGGVSSIQITDDPSYTAPNSSVQMYATEYWNNGTSANITNQASWSTGSSSIATVNNTINKGLVTGVAAGSTTVTATQSVVAANQYCTCNGFCKSTTAHSGSATVKVSAPDHVKVVVDQEGYPAACPSTGVYVRQMQMQVVDKSGSAIASDAYIKESYSNLTTNTCGNGQPVPTSCALTGTGGVGQFLDTMSVSGNFCGSGIKQSSGCGFSLTSTWTACLSSGSNTLWTSPRVTHSNGAEVNGSWAVYSNGTQFH